MAGVHIKGMEMPKGCFECPFNIGVCIGKVAVFEKGPLHDPGEGWCPLEAISDHGDLIDREELIKKMVNTPIKALDGVDFDPAWFTIVSDTAIQFVDEVERQVVIIPADKEGGV